MKFKKLLMTSMMSAAVALPQMAAGDSELDFGPAGTDAEANLDFQIIIPSFLYWQVGDAVAIDVIEFDLTAGPQPGSGGPVASTGGTTPVDGTVTVTLITNAADVSIQSAGNNGGNLVGAGFGGNLPFADITASSGGPIPVPDFGTTLASFNPGGFNLTSDWTYTYDNTNVYVADTYDGRATYTITVL